MAGVDVGDAAGSARGETRLVAVGSEREEVALVAVGDLGRVAVGWTVGVSSGDVKAVIVALAGWTSTSQILSSERSEGGC